MSQMRCNSGAFVKVCEDRHECLGASRFREGADRLSSIFTPSSNHDCIINDVSQIVEQTAAPRLSALSTEYLMGAPLVPKLLRTVRHESPAPVSYTLQQRRHSFASGRSAFDPSKRVYHLMIQYGIGLQSSKV